METMFSGPKECSYCQQMFLVMHHVLSWLRIPEHRRFNCSPWKYFYSPSCAAGKMETCLGFLTVDPLEEVEVAHVLWGFYGRPDLAIIEDYPSAIFIDVSNIVTALSRGANVAHQSHQLVSCGAK